MLSKNLIKANQVILKEKDPRVVDSNDLVAKRLEILFPEAVSTGMDGFQTGLNAPEIDTLFLDEGEEDSPDQTREEYPQTPTYTGPTPEELVAQAQEEIEQMQIEAEKNISFLKKRALEEGRSQGYSEGKRQAESELEQEKQALQKKRLQLEQDYQKKIDELEPRFIETLTGIYEEIFQVDLAGYKTILSHAISNTIRHIEGCRDFLVHVSRTDYEAVMANKEVLLGNLSTQSVNLEIIEDMTLKENECLIETGSGIYDCSIGTQLEEITKKLRLLSYEK